MAEKQGPGKVWLKQALTFDFIGCGRLDIEVHLFNFDIDVPALKDAHLKFLNEKLVPALAANDESTAELKGSASRSDTEAHNLPLSENRAAAVRTVLTAAGVGVRIKKFEALGEPKGPGPNEDEHDRAVFISASFPLTLTDVALWTDPWSRKLTWDDVVGMDGITKINLQLEAKGAPRFWDMPEGRRQLMPPHFRMKADRKGDPYSERTWYTDQLPEAQQPADIWRTRYRFSSQPAAAGFGPKSGEHGVAAVNRESVPISLRLVEDHDWSDRGQAEVGVASNEALERIDAKKLLQSGGVDVLYLRGCNGKLELRRLLRNPAEVVIFSGNGTTSGCLSQVQDCWADPKDLLPYWKGQTAMRLLILAAPHVLNMAVKGGMAFGLGGGEWSKLLKSKSSGGPLSAILGYDDNSPEIKGTGADLARKIGAKIASGVKDDQIVPAWEQINAAHTGKNTWNAVGMDQRGYWWIHQRSEGEQSWDTVPGAGDKYTFQGPEVIP